MQVTSVKNSVEYFFHILYWLSVYLPWGEVSFLHTLSILNDFKNYCFDALFIDSDTSTLPNYMIFKIFSFQSVSWLLVLLILPEVVKLASISLFLTRKQGPSEYCTKSQCIIRYSSLLAELTIFSAAMRRTPFFIIAPGGFCLVLYDAQNQPLSSECTVCQSGGPLELAPAQLFPGW